MELEVDCLPESKLLAELSLIWNNLLILALLLELLVLVLSCSPFYIYKKAREKKREKKREKRKKREKERKKKRRKKNVTYKNGEL